MKRSVQLALFLFLSYLVLSMSVPIAPYCQRTHDPRLCMTTTARYAKTAYTTALGSQAVLTMNLEAIGKRCRAAQNTAQRLLRRADPETAASLKDCANLFTNSLDMMNSAIRALQANDGQSQAMVQIMLQNIRMSAQQCDQHFVQKPNPMAHFDGSIIKMTINCDDLNNMND